MDTIMPRLREIVSSAAAEAMARFREIVPQALLAIAVVLLGWLVASLLHMLVLRLLHIFAIDKLAAKTPLERLLREIGIRKGIAEILASLVFWLAILLTLIVASDLLRLTQVASALTVVTSYIPQIIAALLIVVFGMLLARFLQVLTEQALSRAQIGGERFAGRAVYLTVLVFVTVAATEQLGLRLSFVTTNVVIAIAAMLILLGAALLIGARTLIEGWVLAEALRRQLAPGDEVEIEGVRGRVLRITPAGVVLRSEDVEVTVPASHFTTRISKRFPSHG